MRREYADYLHPDTSLPLAWLEDSRLRPEHWPSVADAVLLRMMRGSGLPYRHLAKTELYGDSFRAALSRIYRQLGLGFTWALLGRRARGKTQMATELGCLRMALHQLGIRGPYGGVRYTTAWEFFELARDAQVNEASAARVNDLARCSLLIVDEVQVRRGTDFEANAFTSLMDRRYAGMRDTLLLSNLELAEFLDLVRPSVASRLEETGMVTTCDWQDYRAGGQP